MPILEFATYRFNPGLELVVFDRLEPALQSSLASLTRDPAFYGVILRADRRAAAATAKAVDRESALLLLTLRTPGPIPAYARRLLGADAANTIAAWCSTASSKSNPVASSGPDRTPSAPWEPRDMMTR